ncbi:hypothetical protein BHM03_00018389 [Ensete ventricosum]|uniref:Uncharacterized protein n=1 Tax=Ensete ventricosum TaxID=4639 RepID=A0A445MFC5_ENSVE|nr:hypothetical protein BHM03_00018389 [Ensete ventricosum]
MPLSLRSHPRVGPEESFLDWGRNSDFEEVTTRIGARHSGSEEVTTTGLNRPATRSNQLHATHARGSKRASRIGASHSGSEKVTMTGLNRSCATYARVPQVATCAPASGSLVVVALAPERRIASEIYRDCFTVTRAWGRKRAFRIGVAVAIPRSFEKVTMISARRGRIGLMRPTHEGPAHLRPRRALWRPFSGPKFIVIASQSPMHGARTKLPRLGPP